MKWEKTTIINQQGNTVNAQLPIVISASRSTDIPAFYSKWFMDRLDKGYVKWINPFNGNPLYVSFDNTRLVVFWSKNPKPMIEYLPELDKRNINYYFQYTLNDYEDESLEPNLPSLENRIDTFIELSELIGKDKVIWRYDPLILTDKISVDDLLRKVEYIGNRLINHTEKLVFSFADITHYKKVKKNLLDNNINYIEFDDNSMLQFAQGLQELNEKWKFEIGTCSEKINLEEFGIVHNKCVDDDLMIKLFKDDKILMDFLGVKIIPSITTREDIVKKTRNNKDSGQRLLCGCIMSKDIGNYNTCPHGCIYCYANTSEYTATLNYNQHIENPNKETI